MGFLSQLFSGIDDVGRGDMGMLDDVARFDFSGAEDRMDNNLIQIMENDALRTVGLPIADFFSFGLASPAAKAKYNKLKTGHYNTSLGDIGKSMAASYIGQELFPVSGTNTLSDVGYNMAAGAGRGAIASGIQGESMTEGAKGGAIGGGIMSGGSYLGNMFSPDTSFVPRDSGQAFSNELAQQSQIPAQSPSWLDQPDNGTYGQSAAPSYVPSGSAMAYNGKTTSPETTQKVGGLGTQFTDFINSFMPASPTRFGDTAQGLLGMYGGYRRMRSAKELRSLLGGNRGAYEQQLRHNLARRDAASGRRSNYAGREVELQSALAQLDSRNAPAMAQLNDARYGGLESMFRSGLGMGSNLGWFGSARPDPQLALNRPNVPSLPQMPTMPLMQPQSLDELRPAPRRWNEGGY